MDVIHWQRAAKRVCPTTRWTVPRFAALQRCSRSSQRIGSLPSYRLRCEALPQTRQFTETTLPSRSVLPGCWPPFAALRFRDGSVIASVRLGAPFFAVMRATVARRCFRPPLARRADRPPQCENRLAGKNTRNPIPSQHKVVCHPHPNNRHHDHNRSHTFSLERGGLWR